MNGQKQLAVAASAFWGASSDPSPRTRSDPKEIAQKSGISQKYLSELERGEKVPSWETLASLAHNGFEIRLASLFFGIDDEEAAAAKYLEDILAGRPEHVRYDVLQAVQLLLQAGERGRTKRK